MTHFPQYLKQYPNMHSSFPFHIDLRRLPGGYPAHRHDFLEFSFVCGGSGGETINGEWHPMVPGTFTFILPYQVHELFTDAGSSLLLYNCMFSMDFIVEAGIGRAFGGLFDGLDLLPAFAQFEGDERDHILRMIEEMHREYTASNRWRETLIKAKLTELLVTFDRFRHAGAAPVTKPPQGLGSKSSVWPIIHYIHNNYQESITLTDLSRRFSMSVSRISEVIKEATGQTFIHFLHDLRIRHASGLLISTEMSVSEIAHEVGYGSYKTFSRVFRENRGVVPTQYRREKGKTILELNNTSVNGFAVLRR